MDLFGRREILSAVDEITPDNINAVMNRAINIHSMNSCEIDYLYKYYKGDQPVLSRKKTVRPEINNRICENHAVEIADFVSGYFLGEPVTYVRRGERESASSEVAQLNDFMFAEDKPSHDKDLSMWMAICGVGYRMAIPDKKIAALTEDESPFELDIPDPRYTFVVYQNGFGHKRLMGVREINLELEDGSEILYCGYTKTHYFEWSNGMLKVWKPHGLPDIPIFEYRLNMARLGAFEPVIPMLDAINTVQSNRADGVEQFVQSFLKFKNCDVDEESIKRLQKLGAISIKTAQGMDGDVTLVSQELNQQQTQTLVDYMYDQVLVICGMPSVNSGRSSTSDTGNAVILRDGWQQAEARARDTELLFKRSEKLFMKYILNILRDTPGVNTRLKLSEVECKFTRRQHDNILTKTQALLNMLESGIDPEVAIASSGLFNDPMDVAKRSENTLHKWDYIPIVQEREEPENAESETEKDEMPNEVTDE